MATLRGRMTTQDSLIRREGMMGSVLSISADCGCANRDELMAGLRSAAAILEAIDEGELLSTLPSPSEAKSRHQTAVTLLSLQHKLLKELIARASAEERSFRA
ncbi:hypothetical protein P7B02_11605 [Caulobacter segnis]|uniref:hypothetical protein n=1 Tax=Caulobacter segnis TaxID=88688 RepID=UPI00240F8CB6|nr:hypothetical protein [Caulobacter segnis]MDG2522187.1 hypothetical protein [Caulobacter segnis]